MVDRHDNSEHHKEISPILAAKLLTATVALTLNAQSAFGSNSSNSDEIRCAIMQAEIQNAMRAHKSELHCMEIDPQNIARDEKLFKLESLPTGFMGKYQQALEKAKSRVKNETALQRLSGLQRSLSLSPVLRSSSLKRTSNNTLRFDSNATYTLETATIPTTKPTTSDSVTSGSATSDSTVESANTTEKSVLVVRVVAPDAETSQSMTQLSDSVFGTSGDPVNLATQIDACSYGQLKFIAAQPQSDEPIFDGVIEVTIDQSVSGLDNSTVRNAVTTALNEKLGYPASSRFDHVMYALPSGTNGGWIAYAYVNSWLSVYNNNWATYVSAQMHEIGHNLGLSHSGEGTSTYADQSGMMGFSYSQDDGPAMCFNAAKSSFLSWYDDKRSAINPGQTKTVSLTGIAEYGTVVNEEQVLLNIDGTQSLHLTFNVAKSMNSGTVEGKNQVMIVEQEGVDTRSYKPSKLLAKLGIGNSYSRPDFGGAGVDLNITVNDIANDIATVTIAYGEPQENRAPTAQAVIAPPGVENTPLEITLEGSDPDGDTISYLVTTQPMSGTLSGNGPRMTYMPAQDFVGNDSFTYIVSDGALDSEEATVTITKDSAEQPNQSPTASFTFSPTAPVTQETVIFDASASTDPEGALTEYAWDFGDGQTASGISVSHNYMAEGDFQVTLTVSDAGQLSDSITQTVTVIAEEDPNSPPAAPSALVASKIKSGGDFVARLSWSDNSVSETNFEIERAERIGRGKSASTSPWMKIADVNANATTYTDRPVRGGYIYRVRAVNANGASEYSTTSEWLNL
jgi:hypothetical protein